MLRGVKLPKGNSAVQALTFSEKHQRAVRQETAGNLC
jgi:hypothetical protein